MPQKIYQILLYVLLISFMVWELSPLPMSLSMIGLVALGLYMGHWEAFVERFKFQKLYVALFLYFSFAVLSFFWTEDTALYLKKLQLYLPMLILPFAFNLLPPIEGKMWRNLLKFFVLLMVVAMLGTLINYWFFHYQEYNLELARSGNIKTPIHHIRFSLLAAFAACVAAYLSKCSLLNRSAKAPLWLLAFGLLVLGVHILGVRSGLLGLYLSLSAYLVIEIFNAKAYRLGLGIMAFGLLTVVLAYNYSPTLKIKISLSKHNYHEYMAGRIGNYSDTRRYVSYQVGIETGNQSPWIGQGLGDADSIFIRKFRAVSPKSMPILPHNQFIYVYGLLGLVGLLLLLFVCLSPIIQYPPLKNPLFFSFQLIAISSFMTETTLETQVGLSFYLTFNLLFIQSQLSVSKNKTMA